jgi:hypothetical protein
MPLGVQQSRGLLTGTTANGTPLVIVALIGANVGVFLLWQQLGTRYMIRNFALSRSNVAQGRYGVAPRREFDCTFLEK